MSNCRFCDNWRDQRLVKYGPRHYAHFRCFLEHGKSLHKLPDWQLGTFPYRLLREFGVVDANYQFVDAELQRKYDRAGCAPRPLEEMEP